VSRQAQRDPAVDPRAPKGVQEAAPATPIGACRTPLPAAYRYGWPGSGCPGHGESEVTPCTIRIMCASSARGMVAVI